MSTGHHNDLLGLETRCDSPSSQPVTFLIFILTFVTYQLAGTLFFSLTKTQAVIDFRQDMSKERSSPLDFSDGRPSNTDYNVEQRPDLLDNQPNGAIHLQRNHTERRRLQGLQRTLTNASSIMVSPTKRTLKEKFNVWLINEGGRQIFFGTWIFLHLLVIAFGFMNFQLKDNLVNARKTFGITYRAQFPFFCKLNS